MEEILLRFPHIGRAIFKELNGKDFGKSSEVNQSWYHFITNDRALQRIYKKRIQDKIHILTEVAKIRARKQQLSDKNTAFHLAAERGYLPVCQQIIENADDKNPKDDGGWTPLHYAARNGHLSVCQLIVENVEDKNPMTFSGRTPLNLAKMNKNKKIQQLIENATSKK